MMRARSRRRRHALLAASVAFLALASFARAERRHFVRIAEDGTSFALDDTDFYVHGFNQVQLMSHAADDAPAPQNASSSHQNGRAKVLEVLGDAEMHGFNVLRTWAFNDGIGMWNALQVYPGIYDEKVFRALDWLLWQCRRHKIRVLLALANSWSEYGGAEQYLEWARSRHDNSSGEPYPTSFYSSLACREMYKRFVRKLLTRRNVYTGVEYKEDDYIFGFDLINEPRAHTAGELHSWTREMADFFKSIDGNHLLTSGSEGFFGPSTPDLKKFNPGDWTSTHGNDFYRNHAISSLDFAVFHVYPDTWFNEGEGGETCDTDCAIAFTQDNIRAHLTSPLPKPVVLEEVGKKGEGRDRYLEEVFRAMHDSHMDGGYGAGTIVWQLSPSNFSDVDSFSIYLPEHQSTSSLMREVGVRVASRIASAYHGGLSLAGWVSHITNAKIRRFFGNRFWRKHILPAKPAAAEVSSFAASDPSAGGPKVNDTSAALP